jgi:hypothetical protein
VTGRGTRTEYQFFMARPIVGGAPANHFYEEAGEQDVRCIITELHTWTARQDGQIFLTGNSAGPIQPIIIGNVGRDMAVQLSPLSCRGA